MAAGFRAWLNVEALPEIVAEPTSLQLPLTSCSTTRVEVKELPLPLYQNEMSVGLERVGVERVTVLLNLREGEVVP